ncbi:MAG: ATP-binding protein [Bacteriovoracales bacterium]|nr:ATP-binding protein [Bacteriovoracales bacterium]
MIDKKKIKTLKNLKNLRWNISTKIYLALACFVLLILLASMLGRNSILDMNEVQKTITKERIPELSLAIKMGQKSVALMNMAPKLLASGSEKEVNDIASAIEENAKRLSEIQKSLKSSKQNLVGDLINNLELLNSSVRTTLSLKKEASSLLAQSLQESQKINEALISEIDDQNFFMHTGFQTLTQRTPAPISRRIRQSSLSHYRGLVSLKAQGQQAPNILSKTSQLQTSDLIQPLRERFRAAIDNCQKSLGLITDRAFEKKISTSIRIMERAGLGGLSTSGEKMRGLFGLQEEIFTQRQLQREYLAENERIVVQLSIETEKMIKGIEDAGLATTEMFTQTVAQKTKQLGALNLISLLLAFGIGFLLVGRHIIGRLKALSNAMLTMSKGNLKVPLNLKGDDEIADMGKALEVFRQYALEAQKLDLVEIQKLAIEEKNNQLQSTIEQLKKAQEQIVMREKLASLGQLTSGIAHELKNPLNFINNFSTISKELLEDLSRELMEPENNLSDESRSFIEDTLKDLHQNMDKVHSHGQRANDIIKGMLQHSREQREDALEKIALNRFIDSCVNLAYQGKRSTISGFNVEFKKEYSDELGEIEVNPQDISQVILNLVSNACDAVEEKNSKLSPSEKEEFAPCIWIQTKKDGEYFEIRVRDNGNGVPKDKAKDIFDPFFTTKPTGQGTGLGLSLCHDMIFKHGGSLKLETSRTEGAEFIVRLPLVGVTSSSKAQTPSADSPTGLNTESETTDNTPPLS